MLFRWVVLANALSGMAVVWCISLLRFFGSRAGVWISRWGGVMDQEPRRESALIVVPESPVEPPRQRSFWLRRLSSENPFYVLSAALVIHSTGLSLTRESSALPLLALVGLIAGYFVCLAAAGVFIVRRWKVWDDARSIPLILVLLLLELSLCFDDMLASTPARAVLCLGGVVLFGMVASEIVIRLLRLNLPWAYRGPYYLQLVLLLGAGAGIALLARNGDPSLVRWGIYGFAVLCGLGVLTLVPAARSNAQSVEDPGCPWVWPVYPWSLFVVLWVCLGFRILLLTLSFDGAVELGRTAAIDNLSGIFGPMFLVPMLLGIGWLLVEAGLAHRRRALSFAGMLLAVLCIPLSLGIDERNRADEHFVQEFTSVLGSPAWCAAVMVLGWLLLAAWRGVPYAMRLCMVVVLAFSRIGHETTNLSTMIEVQTLPFAIVAGLVLRRAILLRSAGHAFEATVWTALGLWATGRLEGWEFSSAAIAAHLVLLGAVGVAILFRGDAAKLLLLLVQGFCVLGGIMAIANSLLGGMTGLLPVAYLLGLTVTLLILHAIFPEEDLVELATFTGGGAYAVGWVETWRWLSIAVAWGGMTEFFLGLALLHVAFLGSAWKRAVRVMETPR